jgi:hypothetical protein
MKQKRSEMLQKGVSWLLTKFPPSCISIQFECSMHDFYGMSVLEHIWQNKSRLCEMNNVADFTI